MCFFVNISGYYEANFKVFLCYQDCESICDRLVSEKLFTFIYVQICFAFKRDIYKCL